MKPRALRSLLDEQADPPRARDVARYLKLDSREVLGLPVPAVHKTAVRFVRASGLPEDLGLLDRWFAGTFEEALCAVFFMGAQSAYTSRQWSVVERWCAAPDTWALADPISVILLAGFRGEGLIDDELLRAWIATEEPFWLRRIALVATTAINQGGPGGPTRAQLRRLGRQPAFGEPASELTLELLERSIHDKRHFIRLAIGWALRVLVEIEPAGVARFVQAHRASFTRAMLNKARLDDDGRRKP
ncbi:MAG TPA: DNA alkylation repair protein [Chloroflexota bacterium]|nr:DNA alkylation repair protein [Chloroflexota bacterium]